MQNQLEDKVYAGFFVRLVAFAIDSLIAGLIVGMVKLPFSIAAAGGVTFLKANFLFDYSFIDVLGYVGVAAYFVLLTYFSHSTLGKKLFRIEVVTTTGEWTFLNILYRETVGRFLSSLLCIGYLAVLVTPEKRGFHDMLCDTNVIYTKMMPISEKKPGVNSVKETEPVTPADNIEAVPEDVADLSGSKDLAGAVDVSGNAGNDTVEKYQSEVEAPVYHTVSSFQKEEEQPVAAELKEEPMNPDCSNLEQLMENRTEES